MSSYLWLRPLTHRLLGRPARRASSTRSGASSRRRVRPCLEVLEERITPDNTYTPTVFTDGVSSGQIKTLRDAINASNADPFTVPDHTDTIQLAAGTYTLNQGQLSINAENHNLIIQGQGTTGPNATIIKQTVADRVFLIDDSNGNPEQIIFKDLVIEGGDAQVDGQEGPNVAAGGGILAKSGEVTLSNVVVRSNAARAGAGDNAQGGGIYMVNGDVHFNASLTIQNSIVADNNAFVGAGGLAQGGGVFGSGPFNISISNSSVSSNGAHGDHPNGDGGSAEGGGVFGTGCSISISGLSHLSLNVVEGGNDSNGGGGFAAGGGVFGNQCNISLSEADVTSNVVKGGNGSNGGGGDAEGGSVFANQGDLSISDSNLSGNTLTGGSGAITGSTSDPDDVGGAAEGGGVWSFGTTSITGGTLSDNILTGGNGTLNNASASVGGDVGGEALGGGAVVAGKSATITTTVFEINNLTGGNGTYDAGTVKGTVGGAAAGGGVYVSTTGGTTPTIDISDSTLSGNFVFGGNGSGGTASPGFASGGGARFNAGSTGELVNSTIADNQAIGGQSSSIIPVAAGGGLFFDSKSSANLTNVTVVGNQASPSATGQGSTSGGGIDNNGGTVTLVNTLVALNGANKGPDYNGAVSNSDHNLISVADGSSGFSTTHGDQLGSESQFLNPHLGQLANNGGPTQTIALLDGSPALGAGDTNGALVTGKFDQRGQGFLRVAFGDIDIGAFEVQPPTVSPPLVVKPPPPSPAAPPTLHTPPLLAFFDGLLGGIEKVNSNETETVIDSIFGIPLFVATYNSAGNLLSVELFGIDVTFLFESL